MNKFVYQSYTVVVQADGVIMTKLGKTNLFPQHVGKFAVQKCWCQHELHLFKFGNQTGSRLGLQNDIGCDRSIQNHAQVVSLRRARGLHESTR